MFWYTIWNLLTLGWPCAIKVAIRKGILEAEAEKTRDALRAQQIAQQIADPNNIAQQALAAHRAKAALPSGQGVAPGPN